MREEQRQCHLGVRPTRTKPPRVTLAWRVISRELRKLPHEIRVTFQEVERILPNGLHDAELVRVDIDYEGCRAIFEVNLDVSRYPDTEDHYRRGRLIFSGIEFVVVDPPAAKRAFGVSMIDGGDGQPATSPCSLPELPQDCFLCWIFVDRANSFIRVAARTVTHQWDD